MYNLKMANIDGRNMYLYFINSKPTIMNNVSYYIYVYFINFLLLFDNTTVMTHLRIKVPRFIKEQKINNVAKEEIKKDKWEKGYKNLQKKKQMCLPEVCSLCGAHTV